MIEMLGFRRKWAVSWKPQKSHSPFLSKYNSYNIIVKGFYTCLEEFLIYVPYINNICPDIYFIINFQIVSKEHMTTRVLLIILVPFLANSDCSFVISHSSDDDSMDTNDTSETSHESNRDGETIGRLYKTPNMSPQDDPKWPQDDPRMNRWIETDTRRLGWKCVH